MSLAEQDEVLLVAPSRTFNLEYDKLRSLFGRWFWHQRVRQKVTLRTLTLRELQQIQRTYREFEKQPEGLDMTVALAVIVGPAAYYLTPEQLSALWVAHCELNHIPFGVAAGEKEDSPTPPSSDDSNGGRSTTNTATSSA